MEQADEDLDRGYEKVTHGFTRDDLEALGERAVRERLNQGAYGGEGHKTHTFVSVWLRDREFVAAEDSRSVAKASALAATVAADAAAKSARTARTAMIATMVIGAITIVVALIDVLKK